MQAFEPWEDGRNVEVSARLRAMVRFKTAAMHKGSGVSIPGMNFISAIWTSLESEVASQLPTPVEGEGFMYCRC